MSTAKPPTGKSPVERAIELLVFAPVGLAVSARDLLPRFVERGRQQVTGQVGMAKMIGQFAVHQGQTEAEKALDRARASARSRLEQLRPGEGSPPAGEPERNDSAPLATASSTVAAPTTPEPTQVAPTPVVPAPTAATPTPAATRSRPKAVRPTPNAGTTRGPAAATVTRSSPNATALAIPAYDSLSASQVVPRLSSLTEGELASVGDYEAGHRARKTILNKVAQLQGH